MARLRYNLVETALAADIDDDDVTITLSAALEEGGVNIPTVAAPDTLAIRIGSEIMTVTAYTSAATSATVTRGEEDTVADEHFAGDPIKHVITKEDFGGIIPGRDETGTSYTVTQDDAGMVLRFTNAGLVTVTLPVDIQIGTVAELLSWGAAGLAVQDDGTSVVHKEGAVEQYEAIAARVVDTDIWSALGPIT